MTDAVSSTTSSAAQANITAGQNSLNSTYTEFLTLLTTQLKNQDPTSPLDTNAFTQQLVAMTGVQQQLLSNQLLQTIAGQTKDSGVSSAVSLIGKTATALSSDAVLSGGKASWSYNLAGDATGATATITDSSGEAVWSGALSDLKKGDHAFSWNGKDFSGVQRADGGTYTLSIAAADGSGHAIASTISVTGVVASVASANGATQVKIGPTPVALNSITAVTSP